MFHKKDKIEAIKKVVGIIPDWWQEEFQLWWLYCSAVSREFEKGTIGTIEKIHKIPKKAWLHNKTSKWMLVKIEDESIWFFMEDSFWKKC